MAAAPPPLLDSRALDFQLYEVLRVQDVVQWPHFAMHARETFDATLETARKIAEDRFRPHNRKADLNEPHIENGRVRLVPEVADAIKAYAEAGFLSAHHDEAAGGAQVPWSVAQACQLYFHAANVGTHAYCFLTIAAANLLNAFGSPDQKRRYLQPLLTGRFLATMCLSEPQAGSSLADIKTRAELLPDGTYCLTGNKMWISGGEHELSENIVHFVLAKIVGAPPGVKGISLFAVPRYRLTNDGGIGDGNDVTLLGLNHKMGWRGTTNTVLSFGDNGGCIGELVGEANRGLAQMFHMMNEARIVIGMCAAAMGSAAYQFSLDYARSRPQGRLPDDKDPASPQVMIIEHADVRRLLLEQKVYAEGAIALGLYCAHLVDQQKWAPDDRERRKAGLLLDILTPVMKAWSSDWALRANENAIQVLGGYGYTRDFPVEQYYRDNRLNPIHEGTNAINAIDLLGRKAIMENGAALDHLIDAIRADIAVARKIDRLAAFGGELDAVLSDAKSTTDALIAARNAVGQRKFLANATLYLNVMGHIVVAWMWLRTATAAAVVTSQAWDKNMLDGNLHACTFFFKWELPKIKHQVRLLDAVDGTCLDMKPDWF